MTIRTEASSALEAFIDESIRLSRDAGYHPTTFISMRNQHGTIESMERLVESGDIQSGFKRLQKEGLANDWSIEAGITKFKSEFSKNAIECAEWRLAQLGDE